MRYQFGSCELDTERVELRNSNELVAVEPQVYAVLLYLLRHSQRVISRDELLTELWRGRFVSDATLANCIKQARRAIGDDGEQQAMIRTVRGHGYRFVAPLNIAKPEPLHTAAPQNNSNRDAAERTLPTKPSLALLGFDRIGDHPLGDMLGEGIANDLNSQLARLHGLFVVARQSARQFSTHAQELDVIGRLLGVRYLVYGAVQCQDRRLRLTIHLTDTNPPQTIWSEHYDRIIDDIFSVQDQIVSAVIAALLPEIERAEMDRARLLPTENLDAWECYHRAMWHNFRFTATDSERAQVYLQQALQLDPRFARAYSGLSFNHFLHAFLHTSSTPDNDAQRSLDYARRSVDIDDRDAMSHWVHGRALFLARDHQQALHALDRALRANPNYAQGHYARGFVGVHAGATEQALSDLDMARQLSPFDPMLFAMKSSRALSLAVQGKLELASQWAVAATEEPNAHFHIHAVAAACLELTNQHQRAVEAIATAQKLHPGYSVMKFEKSFPHHEPAQQKLFRQALLAAGLKLR